MPSQKTRSASFGRRLLAPLLALMLVAPAARAQPPVESEATEALARQHFQEGQAHFDAGRFAEAIAEYQAGYDLSRRPGFLLNIGHAYRRLGDLETARFHYKKFLIVDPTSGRRDEVEAAIRQLDELRTGPVPAPPANPSAGPPGPLLASPAEPPSSAAAVTASGGEDPAPPVYRRTWFWAAVGVVVLGGLAAAYSVRSSPRPNPMTPSLGTLRR